MNAKPKNSLSAADICRIIKECSKSNVTQLKTADFEVNFVFQEYKLAETPEEPARVPQSVENPPHSTENQLVDSKVAEKLVEEEMVATLAITDPVAWEENELKELLDESNGRNQDRQFGRRETI